VILTQGLISHLENGDVRMGIGSRIASKIAGAGAGKLTKVMRKSGKKKKPTEVEGARKDPTTGGSVKAAREVDAGRSGKVNRGKSRSFTEEMQNSSSRKRAKEFVRIKRKDASDRTIEEKKFLVDYRRTELDRSMRAASESSKTQRAKNKGRSELLDPAGRKRERITTSDAGDPVTGEFTEKTTSKRAELLARNQEVRDKLSKDRARQRKGRSALQKKIKSKMAYGGVANKKQHMYVAGGSVKDNPKRRK
jgi:hypothetical protein